MKFWKKVKKVVKTDEKFEEFKHNLVGIFSKWEIDRHTASHGDYCVWIANGCESFEDYREDACLLKYLEPKYKKALWNELQEEIRRRSLKKVETLVIKNGKLLKR